MNHRLSTFVSVFLATLAWPAAARAAQVVYSLAIHGLPVMEAVTQFSIQADLQVIIDSSPSAATTPTNPLDGRYTAEAALQTLLANTGFTFVRVNEKTYAVKPAEPPAEAHKPSQAIQQHGPALPTEVPDETVIVSELRLQEELAAPAPTTVYTQQTLESLGSSSAAGGLKHMSQQPNSFTDNARTNGARYAELRGVGPDQTLILINGRSAAPSGNLARPFDLNLLPRAAMQSMRVISDPDSAQFGPSAAGGIIEIELKKQISEPIGEVRYGAAQGGASERGASYITGLATDASDTVVVVDYFERGALLGSERDLWSNQDYVRFGGNDQRSRDSDPGNVSSLTGGNLPGLPATHAAIPAGSSGVGLTPEDFQDTAGQWNLQSPNRFRSVIPAARLITAVAMTEWDLASATAFSEMLYAASRTTIEFGPPTLSGMIVPASHAFNPFGVAVAVDSLVRGMPNQQLVTHAELSRFAAGVKGEVHSWDWELAATYSSESVTSTGRYLLDMEKAGQALASSDPATALNVFKAGPGGGPELLAWLLAEPRIEAYAAEEILVTGLLDGPRGKPAEDKFNIRLGAEWHQQFQSPTIMSPQELTRTIAAVFAQVELHLSPTLRLFVGGRVDSYSDFGTSFHPQYSLTWRPAGAPLLVRAWYGTNFRAPTVTHLWGSTRMQAATVVDQRRNNELARIDLVTGGNSALKPATATSSAVSLTMLPFNALGPRLDARYWRISMDDRIGTPTLTNLLNGEPLAGDRIVRAAPTDADSAAGLPGVLLSANLSYVNGGILDTSGFDLDISQDLATVSHGTFSTRVALTWVNHFYSSELPGMPAVDRAGTADPAGTVPRWGALASLRWEQRATSYTVAGRYIPEYDDALMGRRNGRTIAAQLLVDVNVGIEIDDLLHMTFNTGLKVSLGVDNIFDESPPFAAGSPDGYDRSTGDFRQRFLYINLMKRFL